MSETVSPFDTIESAQEFILLFEKAIAETIVDVQGDIAAAQAEKAARQLEALRLVSYKLDKLALHFNESRRLLNDLRLLRRLLFNERMAAAASEEANKKLFTAP